MNRPRHQQIDVEELIAAAEAICVFFNLSNLDRLRRALGMEAAGDGEANDQEAAQPQVGVQPLRPAD